MIEKEKRKKCSAGRKYVNYVNTEIIAVPQREIISSVIISMNILRMTGRSEIVMSNKKGSASREYVRKHLNCNGKKKKGEK